MSSLKLSGESAQGVSQLVPLDECGLGIEPAGEAQAANAAGERSKLFGSRRRGDRTSNVES